MVLRRSARRTALKKAHGKNPPKERTQEASAKKCTEKAPGDDPMDAYVAKKCRGSSLAKDSMEKALAKNPMGIIHAKMFTEIVSKKTKPMVKALPETMHTMPRKRCYAKNRLQNTTRIKPPRESS